LVLSVPPGTPAGTFPLKITASDITSSIVQSLILTVTGPDFAISAAPGGQMAAPGGSTRYNVSFQTVDAFAGFVTLNVTGLPSGVSITPTLPASTNLGSTTAISIVANVGAGVSDGSYPFTIVASSGSISHSTQATLIVNSALAKFQYSRPLTINHALVPNSDQANFPVLISGIFPYLATMQNGGHVEHASGYDIIFTSDAAGLQKLNWEVENYDPATGTANYWVQVPNLSHTADTVIYVFYGNSSIGSDQSSKNAVWDVNYQGVWHLQDGTTLSASDSTSNSNNGTVSGATAITGEMGGAASFNGSAFITVISKGSLSGSFTIEEWAKPSSVANYLGLFGSRTPSDGGFDAKLTTSGLHGDIGNGSSWLTSSADATFSYSAGAWHHFVYAVAVNAFQIYADGTQIRSGTFSGVPLLFDSNHNLLIGRSYSGEGFIGAIDEVRISNVVRSADWIATEYNNQSNPSSFVTVGAEAPGNAQ
jgi:hypothetical protein